MVNHTPGPWMYDEHDWWIHVGKIDDRYTVLADLQLCHDSKSEEEMHANGRLMAKAPEMLAFIELVAKLTPPTGMTAAEHGVLVREAARLIAEVSGGACDI